MSSLDSDIYSEETALDYVRGVPLSHVSVEVGHFYMEDLLNGEERIRAQFLRIIPWVKAATAAVDTGSSSRSRVSTCFLIDDYFRDDTNPREILGKLITIAGECGVRIDYIAREAACCVAEDVPLAALTAAKLLPEPVRATNGSRPPTQESGWLCNGERSPEPVYGQAMRKEKWKPPQEFGKRQHSIFLDLELWKDIKAHVNGEVVTQRIWSCPFLASVWHLLRLGMLRHYGEVVASPQLWRQGAEWPEAWDELPAVIQLNPHASPFAAYRSVSVLPRGYLPIEDAVRVILGHLRLDDAITHQIASLAAKEGVTVSRSVLDRISHVFVE